MTHCIKLVMKFSCSQARRQNLAAGGAKTRRRSQNQKGGPHIKNTVLGVCSNREAKPEMGRTDFKWGGGHHCPPASDCPACSDYIWLCIFIVESGGVKRKSKNEIDMASWLFAQVFFSVNITTLLAHW